MLFLPIKCLLKEFPKMKVVIISQCLVVLKTLGVSVIVLI